MKFDITANATVDVSLLNPLDLLDDVRNGDTEALADAVTLVDFDYDINRVDD